MEPKPPPTKRNKAVPGLRARALGLLSRREYSRRELEVKLAPFTENPAEIPELLDDFERRGWLSEQRVVEQVLATRRQRFGIHRITHELREKGVSEAAIESAREVFGAGEIEAARAIWQRKFKSPPADARERARQMRFLQGRGFSLDTIRRLLRDDED